MDGLVMATRNGLEPSTSSVTGWRANRLHHRARTGCIITHLPAFVKGFARKYAFFSYVPHSPLDSQMKSFEPEKKKQTLSHLLLMERVTRLELATSTLARWRSTR